VIREKERERKRDRERLGLREGRKSAWERKRERENVRSREREGGGRDFPKRSKFFSPQAPTDRHAEGDGERQESRKERRRASVGRG